MKNFLIFIIVIFCQSCVESTIKYREETEKNIQPVMHEEDLKQKEKSDFTTKVDLDGDGKIDEIDFDFS